VSAVDDGAGATTRSTPLEETEESMSMQHEHAVASPERRERSRTSTIGALAATVLFVVGLLAVSALRASPAVAADGAALTFTIDPDVQPAQSTLAPARDGDEPRSLASVVDEHQNRANFVADELVLVTDDAAALDEFLARWDGEVLATLDPAEHELPELRRRYLIRIDPGRAGTAELASDLSEANPQALGAHRVSSQQGLALLAAAAREAARGVDVGVNWVAEFGDVSQRSSIEGEDTARLLSLDRNAFTWSHLCDTQTIGGPCPQDTGVAEAWKLLDGRGFFLNGVLSSGRYVTTGVPDLARIGVAILDGGFAPARFLADLHPDLEQFSTGRNPGFCTGFTPCPWHGTNVTSAAVSLPDNDFGAAGPGGFVARPVQIGIVGDLFGAAQALLDAGSNGIRIANMSWGIPIPAAFGHLANVADPLLAALRDRGVMLVAGAGNEGRPVDMVDCFVACWEAAYFWPCEAPKVFCVGALGAQSKTPFFTQPSFGSSNFRGPLSNRDPGETVDFWAPGSVVVGPDPDVPTAQLFGGTSAAAPFVSGVAALVRTANSSLSVDAVEALLLATAQPSDPHPHTGATEPMIDAYAAVRAALGPATPVARAGADLTVDEAAQFTLDGSASSDPDGAALSYSWTQVSGPAATPSSAISATPTLSAPGVGATATLVFELVVSNGGRSSVPDRVVVTVRDVRGSPTPPVVAVPSDIERRTWSTEGDVVTFSASAWDAEDGPLPVTCSHSSGFFPLGTYTVTCWATDSAGNSGSASFNVTVDMFEDDPPK
jgi:serine protease